MARSQRRSGKANKLSQGSMPDLSNHLFWWVMSFLGHKKQVDSFSVNWMKKFNLGLYDAEHFSAYYYWYLGSTAGHLSQETCNVHIK